MQKYEALQIVLNLAEKTKTPLSPVHVSAQQIVYYMMADELETETAAEAERYFHDIDHRRREILLELDAIHETLDI